MAKSKNTMTLDKLASQMREGFKTINDQFRGVNNQFKNVDSQFKNVNNQIEVLASATKNRFDEMDSQFAKIDKTHGLFMNRFEAIETDIKEIKHEQIAEFRHLTCI